MNDLAQRLVGKFPINQMQAREIVSQVFQEIQEHVLNGGKVAIRRFGTFKLIHRAARKCHNPQNGETIKVPAKKTPKFIASKTTFQ
jgi:DNA-binding protein HU-beta